MPRKHFQDVRVRCTASFTEGDSGSAPERENPHFVKSSFFRVIPALLAGALFAGAASVLASTTIGSNISTGGTLSVSGSASIATTTPWGLLSVNPNVIGTGPEFVIGSSTATHLVVTNGGNVGVGIQNPAGLLDVNGKLTVLSGGNVGIGTTSPAWLLQEAGTRPFFAISDISAGVNLKHWTMSSQGGNFYIATSSDLYATSSASVLTINKNGYVGIWTANPGYPLEVLGNSHFISPASIYSSPAGAGYNGPLVDNSAGWMLMDAPIIADYAVDLILGYYNSHEQEGIRIKFPSGDVGVGSTTPWGKFSIHARGANTLDDTYLGGRPLFVVASSTATATTTLFILTNAGNVGIGTSSPWGLLSVEQGTETNSFVVSNTGSSTPSFAIKGVNGNGNIELGVSVRGVADDVSLSVDPAERVGFTKKAGFAGQLTYGSANPLAITQSSGTTIAASNTFTERMRIDTSGNLGIGTTSPWGLLSINPNVIGTGPEFVVGSSTATHFVIVNNGNVGIGSTTPTQVLSVTGNGMFGSAATTTLYLQSTVANKGGCIQLMGANGTAQFRAYATTTGPMILESGTCQ